MSRPVHHLRLERAGAGPSAFETIELRDGVPFALTRHLDRLRLGLAAVGLQAPPDRTLRSAVLDAAGAWGDRPGRLRLTVTDGRGGPRVLAAVAPVPERPAAARVRTTPVPRNERALLAAHKSGAYAPNVASLAAVDRRVVQEVLCTDTTGRLSEAAAANVVIAVDGTLVTPAGGAGCLPGITLELLRAALARRDVEVVARDVSMAELASAQEVFLTATGSPVRPVSQVDDRVLEAPGPLTRAAATAWARAYEHDDDP